MRYTAPPHTSDATLSTGQVLVDEDGVLDAPEVSDTDHAGLVRSGFVPIVESAPAKAAAKAPVAPPAAPAAADAKD
jgi:hypothetical protein